MREPILIFGLLVPTLVVPTLAAAHPGNHDDLGAGALLAHLASSPDHMAMLIVAFATCALAVRAVQRRAGR